MGKKLLYSHIDEGLHFVRPLIALHLQAMKCLKHNTFSTFAETVFKSGGLDKA
jgi:hypothetical protein